MTALSRQTQLRLAEIEDALASGTPSNRVRHDLSLKYDISPRHARRLIRIVELRFAAEADAADRPKRRAMLRQAALTTFRTAMKRQAMALDKEGGEHFYENPDAGAMVRALEFLARLGGDLEQAKLQPDAFGTPDALMAAMHAYYFGRQDGVAEGRAQVLPANVVEVDSGEGSDSGNR